MENRNIALFIDLDNVEVNYQNFAEILEKLQAIGKIAYCKIYGFNIKHHDEFADVINRYGFDTAACTKDSKKKILDIRIVIDALKMSVTNQNVNSFCIIAHASGLAYLTAALKEQGNEVIEIYGDRILNELCDEHIRLVSYFVQDTEGTETSQKIFIVTKLSKFAQEIANLAKSNDKQKRALLAEEIETFMDKNSNAVEILETDEEIELFNKIVSSLQLIKD